MPLRLSWAWLAAAALLAGGAPADANGLGFVLNSADASISLLDNTPAGVLWHDGTVMVCLYGEDGIAVVDPADGHVIRRVRTGRGAHNMFVPPDGHVIYVTNRVAGTISLLDPKSLDVVRALRVPGGPDDMDFAPDGRLWAGLRWAHSGAITRIAVGRSPHGIWLNTHLNG